MSKFKEYLKAIGVDAKTITELEKAEKDDKSDLDVKPLTSEFAAGQRKLFENDQELVASIVKKEQGRLFDMFTRKIKTTFGLGVEAIKDKDWDEVVVIAKTESTKGLDKSLQDLQKELADANTKIKDFEDVQIPKIKQEVENEKKEFTISNKLAKMIPTTDLRVPEDTVNMVLSNQLRSIYDIDLDDNGDLMIFSKGKRLQPKSQDGTKLLTPQDIIGDILKKNKFIKESNADDIDPATGKKKDVTPVGAPAGTPAPDKKALPPHAEAAQKHLEEIKKQKAAAVKP